MEAVAGVLTFALGVLLGAVSMAIVNRDRRSREEACQVETDVPVVRPFLVAAHPVPEDLQRAFSPYAGGSKVAGLAVERDGIHVSYADESNYRFMPVPHDGCLYVNRLGEFEVRRG